MSRRAQARRVVAACAARCRPSFHAAAAFPSLPLASISRRFSTQAPVPHLDTLHHQDTFHHPQASASSSPSPSPSRVSSASQSPPHDPSHQVAVNNLLYNVPSTSSSKPRRRTLCALVTNEAGVLSRVSGCLAGRGVNIDSLVVSETETAGLSRMTIVLKGGADVDQARKQLEDLVQVWAVVEFAQHAPVVERELLLVKLSILPPPAASASSPSPSSPSAYPTSPQQAITSHIQRQAIVELTELFQGRVLDLTPDFMMIELTGKAIKIDAFIELVRPFGIKELARSGVLAMLRGSITGVGSRAGKAGDGRPDAVEVDASLLPPG